jgi:tripartite-type tricarboxylate transporter receptor subunit TctC
MVIRRTLLLKVSCLTVLVAAVAAVPAVAQTNPLPISNFTITVPLAAGGPADVVARAIGQQLSKRIDRTVLIENKTGAGGNIGAAAIAKATPDGLNWLFTVDSVFTSNPHVYRAQGFDPDKDLVPVSGVGWVVLLLAVNAKKVPAKTWQELVEYSKASRVNCGSGGIGSPGHLAVAYLQLVSALQCTHVPYRGAAPVMQDLLRGNVEAAFVTSGALIPHVKSGVLRALAVSTNERVRALPNVPGAAEAGIKDFDARFATMIFTQPNVPAQIRQYVGGHVREIVKSPELHVIFDAMSIEPYPINGNQAQALIAKERERWGRVINASGVMRR